MIVFEVLLNGKRVALAGTKDLGVLSAHVSAVGKLGPATKRRGGEDYDLHMSVGGLTARKRRADEHVHWLSVRALKLGDEVMIRLAEGSAADQPRGRKPADGPPPRVSEKKRFEFAKAMYYGLRSKYERRGLTSRSTRTHGKRAGARSPRAGQRGR